MRTLAHHHRGFRFLAAALLFGWAQVQAASPPAPAVQAVIEALSRAQAAVVGVQVTAIEGSRSAEALGLERSGSGVVIGADGLILTIGYLMQEADSIQIVTQDNKTLPARAVAYDLATGFGLVRPLLPWHGPRPMTLGSLKGLQTGEVLMTATGGEEGDVAMTRLVSQRPFSGYWEYHIDSALFTSPPIARHSGAPLFNQKGELLGIGSLLVLDAAGGRQRLPGNMFVPVDLLKPILGELQRTGSSHLSHRPWLGLASSEQGGHVLIVRVSQGGPAEAAGLQPGDVVLAVDGAKVATLEAFYKKLWVHAEPEAEIRLTVLQGSALRTIVLKGVDRMSTMQKPAGI
ncbi:S1C family serine protease [Variovorax terrae]|uniref:S1C family serine protease n=1 Tax=Variovorax terrae TaxID=2923278 RepID=A0A9X2AQE2_9BURK|nr:S1C family serine protease [Variovorax terrae]MCJ0764467.1 S1C family serine protease [Variovorax terrae]